MSLHFLFFVPHFGAAGGPPSATWLAQQFRPLVFLQNPTPHSAHLRVVFLSTKCTRLHQIQRNCFFVFIVWVCWRMCSSLIGTVNVERDVELELSAVTQILLAGFCDEPLSHVLAYAIISKASSSANWEIVTLCMYLDLIQCSFQISVTVIPIKVVYDWK